MFRSLSQPTKPQVQLIINGRKVNAPEGSSVWSAMALSVETTTQRAPVSGEKRSAYCAMGGCFECLVEIDKQPDRQACMTQVREGMNVKCQNIIETTQLQSSSPANPGTPENAD